MHPAVTSEARLICVIAAPGSGKTTRILIPKAAAILEPNHVSGDDVLLLTFSRVSAIDLRQKVAALANAPRANTVHSFALSFLLSENNHDIRGRIESILLTFQKDVLLADLKLVFPATHLPDLGRRLEEFSAGWATRPHDEVFAEDEDKQRFKAAVVNWLIEHEAAMMEEIIYNAVALARQLGDDVQFPGYILVDEFQDLNRLEQEFIELVGARAELLLVVGDPDQSIYSFKFAYPSGILDFSRRENVETHTSLVTGRCPRRIVEYANRLLLQAEPNRAEFIEALPDAREGEVHFVRKPNQSAEFAYVLRSIAERLTAGESPSEIIVLAPRRKLCREFSEYAANHKVELGIPDGISITAIQKDDLTPLERERLMLFGLLVRPTSLLHARTYIGLSDKRFYAEEIRKLKVQYGDLRAVIENARSTDVPRNSRRFRVCQRIESLRAFIAAHAADTTTQGLLDELFPSTDENTRALRSVLDGLVEEGDSPSTLYGKYVDYARTLPVDSNAVRVMTLLASKGLGANHVYIIGCNDSNIPGQNRSVHMTDAEYRQEQLRLLYVGFTRAKQSLTVTWARNIPFGQARQQNTPAVRIARRPGQPPVAVVSLSEFLQNLGVQWET